MVQRLTIYLLLLAVLFPSRRAGANESESPNTLKFASPLPTSLNRAIYVARVPKGVLKYRPKTGTTRFYGRTKVKGQSLALHLYDVKPPAKVNQYNRRLQLKLDVFAVGSGRKRATYRLLNSVPCLLDVAPTEPVIRFEVATLWLDPEEETKPIILVRRTVFRQEVWNAFYLFFCFPEGYQKPARVGLFGTSRSIPTFQMSHLDFEHPDENGFLTILHWGNQDGDLYITAYKWDGTKFAEFQKRYDYYGDPIYYMWNGKKFIERDMSKDPPDARLSDD